MADSVQVMSDGTLAVKVACCLPQGLLLETGTPGTKSFLSAEIIGTVKAGSSAITFPNRKGLKFGVTLVRKDLWDAWLAKNKTLRYVVDKSVLVVP